MHATSLTGGLQTCHDELLSAMAAASGEPRSGVPALSARPTQPSSAWCQMRASLPWLGPATRTRNLSGGATMHWDHFPRAPHRLAQSH